MEYTVTFINPWGSHFSYEKNGLLQANRRSRCSGGGVAVVGQGNAITTSDMARMYGGGGGGACGRHLSFECLGCHTRRDVVWKSLANP